MIVEETPEKALMFSSRNNLLSHPVSCKYSVRDAVNCHREAAGAE